MKQSSLLMAIVVLLAAGCTPAPVPGLFPPRPGEPVKTIYVTQVAWHTGIAVKVEDIPDGLWPQHKAMLPAKYLEVGWGDGGYYRAGKPNSSTTLAAAFLPTESVVHVMAVTDTMQADFPKALLIEVDLSEQGLRRLCQYIGDTYAPDDDQRASPGVGLYGPNSRFFWGREKFHLCKTCNVWTGGALRAAGCPVRSSIVAEGVIKDVKKFGRLVQKATLPDLGQIRKEQRR